MQWSFCTHQSQVIISYGSLSVDILVKSIFKGRKNGENNVHCFKLSLNKGSAGLIPKTW